MSASAIRRARSPSEFDSLTAYLHEIRAYPLLTREDEVALAVRIREGDTEALNELVCANLRFVVAVAKKYQNYGVTLPDLINEGNLGLIRAAEKFDETKGVKFISYAVWWIRQAIVQALAELGHAVRVPPSRAGMLYRIGRHANSLRHELGREPTEHELAVDLDVPDAEIANTVPIARSYLSLDAPMTSSDDVRLLDYLADDEASAPDADLSVAALSDSVDRALAELSVRDAQVLRLYFGLDGNEPITLEAIGELLGITRERVRQIKEKALARLRKSAGAKALASFSGR